MARIQVRRARPGEADTLTALMRLSKAHWGYDAEFMKLCEPVLTMVPSTIQEGRVWVAEADGVLVGVASVVDADAMSACDFELDRMFVNPASMGHGVGRLLFDETVEWVRSAGGRTMEILADPDAVPFYERMGAKRIGDAPSDAIPGRSLPLLVLEVSAD
jgi:GNAT superfamily N-acetyltransferase